VASASKPTLNNKTQRRLLEQAGRGGSVLPESRVRKLAFRKAPDSFSPNPEDPIKDGLLPEHARYLYDRAVGDDVAIERGYFSARRRTQLADRGFPVSQQLAPSLCIPLWSVRGEVESYQIRADVPRIIDGKVVKFETLAGSSLLIDFHPRLTRGEIPPIKDPREPLVITEGIPKADAAVTIEIVCGGLVGVYGWISTNSAGGTTASIDWRDVALKNRLVVLIFDSDLMRKRPVWRALQELARFLKARGARVKFTYLPDRPGGAKCGLDDYIFDGQAAGKSNEQIRKELLDTLTRDDLTEPPLAEGEEDDIRPVILALPERMPEVIEEAERELVANAERLRIFNYGPKVVRIIKLDKPDLSLDGALRKPAGTVQLTEETYWSLRNELTGLIRWQVLTQRGIRPGGCPPDVPSIYLEMIGRRKLPFLYGLIEAPLLKPDGTILAPGYDAATGLFLASDEPWLEISPSPTKDDAIQALNFLKFPFRKFPFTSKASQSAHLATLLGAIQRRIYEAAPITGYTAPETRTGKSKLAESIGLILMGRVPAAQAISGTKDELKKEILALLLQGHPIINLDNLPAGVPLTSEHLSRAITQSLYGGRELGKTNTLEVPTNVQWTATGCNLSFDDELKPRALLVSLDAEMARPGDRKFDEKFEPYLLANRRQLVAAILTILLAYDIAGRPDQMLTEFGGFEQWRAQAGSALVWLGEDDPCETRELVEESASRSEADATFFAEWYRAFGDREVLVSEIQRKAESGDEALRSAVLGIARDFKDSSRIDWERFGFRMRGYKGRVIGGLRLAAAKDPDDRPRKRNNAQLWVMQPRLAPGTTSPIIIETRPIESPAYSNGATTTPPESAPAADESADLANTLSAFVVNIIAASRARGLTLNVVDGRLIVNGPGLTNFDRGQFARYESEIVGVLQP